jgi:hypothetical protein
MEKPILANELITALGDAKRNILGWQGGKYAEGMRRNVQTEIVTAQKFVLSKGLIEHAVQASMAKPEILFNMLERGIPPFNSLWIEWDEVYRQELLKKIHESNGKTYEMNETIMPVGYHIMKHNNDFIYALYTRYETEGKAYMVSPQIGFTIDNEKPFDRFSATASNEEPMSDKDWNMASWQSTSAYLGSWYVGEYMNNGTKKDKYYLDQVRQRLTTTQTASMHWMISQDKFDYGWDKPEMRQFMEVSYNVMEGDARFMIALLGLLNYDLIATETVIPPKKIDHIAFGRKVPKNEYKVVTINLPKPRGKRVYSRMFTGQGSPKREHWRRGHWRVLKNKKGDVLKRIWIDQQKVGNAELGKITHDYVLNKKDA